jgi:RNA polymerase sigma-70 factor (ECF subfamily)
MRRSVILEPQRLDRTDTDDIPDDVLIGDIAAGDRDAFRVLTQRYTRLFYAVAMRAGLDRTEAEDVAQDTLLRVWRSADTWRRDGGASVRTWLYRIAWNICTDRLRQRKSPMVELPDDLAATSDGADKIMHDDQRKKIVGAAVAMLPERQRAALILCHYEGLSHAEAGAVLGASAKAVEGLVGRARQELATRLKKYKGVL